MLILQRREQQALLIGENVRVVVLKTDGGGVRLGIEAPAEITILREEIVDEVRAENLLASTRALEIEGARRPAAGRRLPDGVRYAEAADMDQDGVRSAEAAGMDQDGVRSAGIGDTDRESDHPS